MKRLFLGALLLAWPVGWAFGEDITQFRGANGSGRSNDKGLPVNWTEAKNVDWRAKLPGPGTSSPIALSERVYLTCYSGYGLIPGAGDMKKLRRHVVCIDRKNGKILWNKEFEPALPESRYSSRNNSRHGYSSSTIATDGKHLFVFFGKSGVYCLDLQGKEVWKKSVGSRTHGWGSSNSPVLYKNLVIVNGSIESQSLVAFNKKTGKEVWRVKDIRRSWNTPVLVDVPGGKTELVVNDATRVLGIDPDIGKELWHVSGFSRYVCPSVIVQKGIIYTVRSSALAIRPGGRGDVTKSHVLWNKRGRSTVPSPVYHDGHIYWASRGSVYCIDAKSGKMVYNKRLTPRAGIIYSSLLAADGKLYCVSQKDGAYVIAAGPKFKQLAHNTFADDNSRTNASPIASNGQLLLRTDQYLYCIGKKNGN